MLPGNPDDLDPDDIFLNPEEDETVAPNKARKPRRAQRLQPLPGWFSRAPLQWMQRKHNPRPALAEDRLLYYLLFKSHWGQIEIRVSDELAAEISIPPSTKRRCIARLSKTGCIRIVRREGASRTAVVTVLVHNAG
jgi:hypothetical protein